MNRRWVAFPDVKHGDVVQLAVTPEARRRVEAWTRRTSGRRRRRARRRFFRRFFRHTNSGALLAGRSVRSATRWLGAEGVLRARVADRATRVAMCRRALRGATTLEAERYGVRGEKTKAEEETKVPKEETKVPKEETKVLKEETKVPKEATKVPKEATEAAGRIDARRESRTRTTRRPPRPRSTPPFPSTPPTPAPGPRRLKAPNPVGCPSSRQPPTLMRTRRWAPG